MADNKRTYDSKPESAVGWQLEIAVVCDFNVLERSSAAQRSRSEGFPSSLQLKRAATTMKKAVFAVIIKKF